MQRLTIVLGSKFIPNVHRIKLFSTSSFTKSSDFPPNLRFADHLVHSLGFSSQQAVSISTRLSKQKKKVVDFNSFVTANSVVSLFRNHGFDDAHIRKIVNVCPQILFYNGDKTLNPKLKFLQELGFSESDIIRLVSTNLQILRSGVQSVILPTIQTLTQVMGGCHSNDTRLVKFISNSTVQSFQAILKFLQPNVSLLSSYGIPIEVIRRHIVQRPRCYVQRPDVLKDMMMRVENKLGISRDSPGFMYGVELLSRFSEETLESKYRLFKTFGWTQSDLETFVVKNSSCFSFSEALIKKKLDFLMNELQYKPDQLTSNVNLITCSLEKRIVPRHKVLLILKEKDLLKKNPSFQYAVGLSEPRFLMKFVIPFKEVHQIYAKHTGCSMKMLKQECAISIS
ncbi:hypothetical protein vseg_010833 [Gypsophila vaccaria]